MSRPTFSIANATYDNKNKDIGTLLGVVPISICFKPDGTKAYIGTDDKYVYQVSLSTARDISTATSDSKSVNMSGYYSYKPYGIYMKDDGTSIYAVGDSIQRRTLSTARNISTATYSSAKSTGSNPAQPSRGITISSDGTKFIIGGSDNYSGVYNYTTGTERASDASSYTNKGSTYTQSNSPQGYFISDDGTKGYMIAADKYVYQYTFSTAWDMSTISYDNVRFSVGTQITNYPLSISFSTDGSKMYAIGSDGKIYQYTTYSASSLKTVNGLAKASIKTANGLAIASVKTFNGLA